jgi:hypothetical protein
MEIRVLDVAQQELDETVEYYNNELPGLGDKFLLEVLSSLERIQQFPEACIRSLKIAADARLAAFPMA